MYAFLVLGISAFVFCLVLTPICRDLFHRAGLVDRPDADRKFHLRAVPRMGGIPIALSYALSLMLVLWFTPGSSKIYIQHQQLFFSLLPAAGLIFMTGLLDDLIGLKPWQKLAGQLAAAILAVSFGAHLSNHHLHPWVSILLSVGWLVGCTNAVNLIDGMDGLATGVGLLATLTTLFVALLGGNAGLALATVPLAGALLAFLRYNFSPASVFLGDCGSLTIGFVLGCFGLVWSQRTGTMLGMVAPLMALSLPLIDVGLAIGRRFLRAVPIFKGDRGHIHHMVLALGFSTRGAVLVLYAVCGVFASLAVLASFSARGLAMITILLFCGFVLAGVHRLGYIEFRAARKTLSRRNVLLAVQEEIYLQELSRSLLDADTIDAWWLFVRTACSDLRFTTAELHFNGKAFYEEFVVTSQKPSCRMEIDLGEHGYLLLTRVPENTPPRVMMAVLHHLQSSIEQKDLLFRKVELSITSAA